jgi:hypothetical protein
MLTRQKKETQQINTTETGKLHTLLRNETFLEHYQNNAVGLTYAYLVEIGIASNSRT